MTVAQLVEVNHDRSGSGRSNFGKDIGVSETLFPQGTVPLGFSFRCVSRDLRQALPRSSRQEIRSSKSWRNWISKGQYWFRSFFLSLFLNGNVVAGSYIIRTST